MLLGWWLTAEGAVETRVYCVLQTMEKPRATERAALCRTAVAGAAKGSHVPGLPHYTSEMLIMVFV